MQMPGVIASLFQSWFPLGALDATAILSWVACPSLAAHFFVKICLLSSVFFSASTLCFRIKKNLKTFLGRGERKQTSKKKSQPTLSFSTLPASHMLERSVASKKERVRSEAFSFLFSWATRYFLLNACLCLCLCLRLRLCLRLGSGVGVIKEARIPSEVCYWPSLTHYWSPCAFCVFCSLLRPPYLPFQTI